MEPILKLKKKLMAQKSKPTEIRINGVICPQEERSTIRSKIIKSEVPFNLRCTYIDKEFFTSLYDETILHHKQQLNKVLQDVSSLDIPKGIVN